MGNQFETNDRTDQCTNEEYPPEINRLVEKNYAEQNRTHSANTRPHCIGSPDRQNPGYFI